MVLVVRLAFSRAKEEARAGCLIEGRGFARPAGEIEQVV